MRSLGKSEDGLEQFIGVEGDRIVLKTTYDNEPVIEQNKRMQGMGMGKELRLAASIPPGVQMEWLVKHGVRFWDPNYYRTYLEQPGEPAGYWSVEHEIKRYLTNPQQFLEFRRGCNRSVVGLPLRRFGRCQIGWLRLSRALARGFLIR